MNEDRLVFSRGIVLGRDGHLLSRGHFCKRGRTDHRERQKVSRKRLHGFTTTRERNSCQVFMIREPEQVSTP